jgi:biofilm PGA synthesis lipoprotein PgaB
MPRFENAADPNGFYESLVSAMRAQPLGQAKTIFELQTVDWRTATPISSHEIRDTMRWLQSLGVRHLAYYPEDFILGHPKLRALREGISLAEYPIEVPR